MNALAAEADLTRDAQALYQCLVTALPGGNQRSYRALAELARVDPIRKDALVFRDGDPIEMAMFLDGYGAFRRTTQAGQELIVAITPPGHLYGITAMSGIVTSVDLFALTDGRLASWRGEDVRPIVMNDMGLAMGFVDRMASFLNHLTMKLDGYLHEGAQRRVVRVLARYPDLFFSDPPVLTRAHLPALVGTSREMTARVLRGLERDGVLQRVGRNGLRLLRPELLEHDFGEGQQP